MIIDPIRAARLSPSAFARYATKGSYALPRHVRLLERKLVELAAGRIRRLAVSVPPRHGKSWMCSKFFPAWFLGTFPDKRVILVSYEADFAAQWGRAVRDLLVEHGPTVFGVTVRQDSSAANRWDIVGRAGGMQTAGASGPIMGKGADLLIVDDPHKNWDEIFHESTREKVWELFQSSSRTRLEPGAGIAILQQRWHDQDLLGHVLELDASGAEKWDRVDFPALAEAGDVLGRKPGEALWPERYDEAALEAHRVTVHSKFWEAQFQQRPTPLVGGLFKKAHARRYTLGEDGFYRWGSEVRNRRSLVRFQTIDTATSEDTRADYTAISTWGLTETDLLLLDLDMRQIEAPAIVDAVKSNAREWDCVPWIEETTQSKHLLQFLETQNVPFRVVSPGSTEKLLRALPASALWEQGKVVLPDEAPYLPELERQLFAFPGGKHDDFVDTLSYAAQVALNELWGSAIPTLRPAAAKPVDDFERFAMRAPPGM